MNEKTTIVLFVGDDILGGPWSVVNLDDEILELSRIYCRVLVVCVSNPGLLCHGDMPENVEVAKIKSLSGGGRRLKHIFKLLFRHRSIVDHTKGSLAFSLQTLVWADAVSSFIKDRNIDLESTLFCSAWFDAATAGLALLSQRIPIDIVCRSLSAEGLTDRYMSLRKLTAVQCRNVEIPGEAASGYVRRQFGDLASKIATRLPAIARSKQFPQAGHHAVTDRCLTFLSVANVELSSRVDLIYRFMRALAVARSSTSIKWIHVGDGPMMSELAITVSRAPISNLEVDLRGSLSPGQMRRVYNDEPIDWTIQISLSTEFPLSAFMSLAHGVPVVAAMSESVEEVLTDDCALLLAPDSQPEEFIRGILPYIESDYRMDSLRSSALSRFHFLFNQE